MEDKDLKNKVVAGSIWSIIESFSLQIVQFIVGIILARILGPSEFGLIAMTGIFISLCAVISDGGFEKTLIQQQKITQLQISTIFFIITFLGFIMALAICFLAPHIAIFFNEPLLKPVLQVLSIGVFVDSLGQVQRVLLAKELHFKKLSLIKIISVVSGGVTGIVMAISGYGVWALVASSLVGIFINTVLFWINSSWYPIKRFSYNSIIRFIPFGLNVLASSILFVILGHFNTFIVGKYYSKGELGLYSRGEKIPDLLVYSIQTVLQKISFPLFSKIQNDNSTFITLLKKTNKLYAFIAFPLLGFTFLNANEIVIFLLTEKWIGATIFLQLFCIVKLFDPLKTIAREALLAKGYANLLLKIFVFSSFLEIIPILIFISSGIIYVVWISIISHFIQYLIYIWAISKKLNFKMLGIVSCVIPYLIASLISLLAVYGISKFYPDWIIYNVLFKLIIDMVIGCSIYILLSYLSKFEELSLRKNVLLFFVKK